MKKMIQRLITLTAAMAIVFSMTTLVCSADYEEENGIATCALDWEEEDDDSFRD